MLGPPGEKKNRKGKRKRQRTIQKGPEEHSLVMNKLKILNGGKKRTQFGGPKERKARRACQKAMMASMRVVFALSSPTKVQARTFTKTKAEERVKKEKAKKEPFLNPDSQPQKHPMRKDMARLGNHTIRLPVIGLMIPGLQMLGGSVTRSYIAWMMATPLNLANHPTCVVLDLGCARWIGSRTAIERFKKHAL